MGARLRWSLAAIWLALSASPAIASAKGRENDVSSMSEARRDGKKARREKRKNRKRRAERERDRRGDKAVDQALAAHLREVAAHAKAQPPTEQAARPAPVRRVAPRSMDVMDRIKRVGAEIPSGD